MFKMFILNGLVKYFYDNLSNNLRLITKNILVTSLEIIIFG